MKKWTILLVTLLFIGMIFWSCSSEDDGTTEPTNIAPTCAITSPFNNTNFTIGDTILIQVDAEDEDGTISEVRFYFDDNGVGLNTSSPYSCVIQTDSCTSGTHSIEVIAEDNDNKETECTINIILNTPPKIDSLTASDTSLEFNETVNFTCNATDADGDIISYSWSATVGTINGTNSSITWTAPDTVGTFNITCVVSDGIDNDTAIKSITVYDVTANMVFIQGGTFLMGDHFNEGYSDELPVHSVNLNNFYIGNTEVTQAEWAVYMLTDIYNYGVGDNYPVYYVSWYETIKYCNLRSIGEGLEPCYTIDGSTNPANWGAVPDSLQSSWDSAICNWTANGYRLPSEAEWEYASRGGTHWTDNFRYSGCHDEVELTNYAWYATNHTGTAQPVRTKLPNQIGLYDMSGNLWEWCWDWDGSNYYTTCNDLGTITDPTGAPASTSRILRGGRWFSDSNVSRVAVRGCFSPYGDYYSYGFRIVRTKIE